MQHAPCRIVVTIVLVLCVALLPGRLWAQSGEAVLSWSFDRVTDGNVPETISGTVDKLQGNYRLLPGVKGQALVLDGYTTCLAHKAGQVPNLAQAFTIEAWVALGAYPWNWAPLAAQENTVSKRSNKDEICWPEDIEANLPQDGFFFGIDPQGHLGLQIGAGQWQICRTERQLPLRTWTHVAATYRQGRGIVLYVNGEEAGRMNVAGNLTPARTEDLRIGMPHQMIEPSHPVRTFATLACWYALDGALDELKIYDQALDGKTVSAHYTSSRNPSAQDLPARQMPSGPAGQGTFGASYVNLQYYPEWDALWPVGADPDIVVQFDHSPVRVVFWRGTRYSPVWVMDNNLWMADQSIENFNGKDGCLEHMLDARCRFSHVRIIENTPARVVVHWRYCPTAADGNHSQVNPISNWEDWVDEYYTFYPDGIGVRKVIQHTDGQALWPEEVIGMCQPGQRPEDVVELAALTLVNLQGKQHTYSWADKSPVLRTKERREQGGYIDFGDAPGESPNIMMVNFKSQYKPFQIFELNCNFSTFAHEQRKDVCHFPWWNHWPVALIPSDGRYCQAADRASHFSLAWASPQPHPGQHKTYWWTWLYGATRDDATTLTLLARSWTRPPAAVVSGAAGCRYDSTQRCYVVSLARDAAADNVTVTLKADAEHPVYNPALVLENWGDRSARLQVNGNQIWPGRDLCLGPIRRVNDYDLVVWLRLTSDQPVTLSLTPGRAGSRR